MNKKSLLCVLCVLSAGVLASLTSAAMPTIQNAGMSRTRSVAESFADWTVLGLAGLTGYLGLRRRTAVLSPVMARAY